MARDAMRLIRRIRAWRYLRGRTPTAVVAELHEDIDLLTTKLRSAREKANELDGLLATSEHERERLLREAQLAQLEIERLTQLVVRDTERVRAETQMYCELAASRRTTVQVGEGMAGALLGG